VLQAFLDEIVGELRRGNRLEFRNFGVFRLRSRAARIARNPKTGEQVIVPPRLAVEFKPGRRLKDVERVMRSARAARTARTNGY